MHENKALAVNSPAIMVAGLRLCDIGGAMRRLGENMGLRKAERRLAHRLHGDSPEKLNAVKAETYNPGSLRSGSFGNYSFNGLQSIFCVVIVLLLSGRIWPLTGAAPAIANAFFAAAGVRLRHLPMLAKDVLAALAEGK